MAEQNTVASGSFSTNDNEFITDEMLFAFPTTLAFDLTVTECPSFLQVTLFVIDSSGTNPLATIRVDGPQSVSRSLDLADGGKYRARIESGEGLVMGSYVVTSTMPLAIPP
jgi:hypothetical protein